MLLRACVCVCVLAAVRADEVRRALAAGGAFRLLTTVELSAPGAGAPVGYRLAADLAVAPLPADPDPDSDEEDPYLQFTLSAPVLWLRGAHPSAEWEERGAAWAGGGGGAWAARGARLRLPRADPPDLAGYKRALASLFHYRGGAPGREREEADPAGTCAVAYETLPGGDARRVKLRCAGDAAAGAAARRAARYTLAGGALAALRAEELLLLPGGLKARSRHELARRGPAPPPAPGPAAPLAPAAAPAPAAPPPAEARAALAAHGAALGGAAAGGGGDAAAARALLQLLPALRAASAADLAAALRDPAHRDVLPGLCRVLGLTGTAAAVRAARDFLQPAAADPLEALALDFLAGFALAPQAEDEAVADVVRLAGEARRDSIAAAALLGAAAAARGDAPRAAVRDAIARALQRCRDAACRAARLRALGNLRSPAAADALLERGEREPAPAAAAALAALRGAPALRPELVARLDRLVTDGARPLEARAAALEAALAARAGPGGAPPPPVRLARVARALHAERSRAAHELRRVLWARLEARPRTWEARAHGGASGALSRALGWRAEGWAARLRSLQLAARGVLRRGEVELLALAPDNTTHPLLEISVWTRGLEALAGEGGASEEETGEGEGEEEGVAGGLAVAVAGYHLQDITLFDGQAELLGHIWAGRGSEATPAVRALRPLAETRAALPLLGGAVLRVTAGAALALALDAHAAASLWHRTARGAVSLRAAAAGEARAELSTAWGELGAERRGALEPRLRVALDLDFGGGAAAACVRAHTAPHRLEEEARVHSAQGARRWRVSRGVSSRTPAPPRTLALGRANDAACRALRAAPDDD